MKRTINPLASSPPSPSFLEVFDCDPFRSKECSNFSRLVVIVTCDNLDSLSLGIYGLLKLLGRLLIGCLELKLFAISKWQSNFQQILCHFLTSLQESLPLFYYLTDEKYLIILLSAFLNFQGNKTANRDQKYFTL